MKILVTGGAGFIGSNIIKKLLTSENEIHSLDNYTTGLNTNEVAGCKYWHGDIQHINTMDKDFDVVYHMAAIARIQPSFERPADYIETNFNGTYEVVKFCTEYGIPLVYAGSSSKHSGRFKNPYTFSKDIGEDIVKLYQEHFNLKASIARFYNVYGCNQLLEGGYTTLIGRWINNLTKGIACEIYGDGEKRRDFTHVDDIVDALTRIVNQGKYGYEFELGRGENFSVNEIATAFGIEPLYREDKPGEAKITLNTDTTAREILGWNPQKNIVSYIKSKEWKE